MQIYCDDHSSSGRWRSYHRSGFRGWLAVSAHSRWLQFFSWIHTPVLSELEIVQVISTVLWLSVNTLTCTYTWMFLLIRHRIHIPLSSPLPLFFECESKPLSENPWLKPVLWSLVFWLLTVYQLLAVPSWVRWRLTSLCPPNFFKNYTLF